jgi:hypothetical protein
MKKTRNESEEGGKQEEIRFEGVESASDKEPSEPEYIYQPKIAEAIKEKSDYARWLEKERLRLSGLSGKEGTDHFDREYQIFEQESEAHSKRLRMLFEEAEQERQARREIRYRTDLPPPSPPYGFHPPGFALLPRLPQIPEVAGPMPPPWWDLRPPLYRYEYYAEQHTLKYPLRALVYHGVSTSPSDDIGMKPDGEHWIAQFRDAETTLSLQYRYWLPERSLDHATNFLGGFSISPHLYYRGLVDIKSGGKVTVQAETAVGLRLCTHWTPMHDLGWHYDSAYDSVIDSWLSRCQFPGSYSVEDTQQGLHVFPEGAVYAVAEGSVGAGSRFFLDVTQMITITAENAQVHFELNNVGTIYTPYPTLTLHYGRRS